LNETPRKKQIRDEKRTSVWPDDEAAEQRKQQNEESSKRKYVVLVRENLRDDSVKHFKTESEGKQDGKVQEERTRRGVESHHPVEWDSECCDLQGSLRQCGE